MIENLLQPDQNNRLGKNGSEEVFNHSFFSKINFNDLIRKKISPPWIPEINEKSPKDFNYVPTPHFGQNFVLENFTYECPKHKE